MKNVIYFMVKALFVLKISTYFSWLLGYVEKRLVKNYVVNSKMYYATDCTKDNFNAHIVRYLKK